jgi:hypothetical protein
MNKFCVLLSILVHKHDMCKGINIKIQEFIIIIQFYLPSKSQVRKIFKTTSFYLIADSYPDK